MTGHEIKAICEFVSAMSALFAAAFWFAAARHPVSTGGGPAFYAPPPDHPLWAQMKAHGERILRGAKLNQVAAALTGISALAQFLAWLFSSP
jgi:hypothetical protein